MESRIKLLASVSVGALAVAPQAALAGDSGQKWGPHIDVGGKFGDRNIGSADFFMPIWQDQFSLLFADIRGRFDDDSSQEGNFGLGYRKQVNKDWILGGYAFYDIKNSSYDNTFNQFTAGFEALSEDWEFRVNGYLPEDDQKPVSGAGGMPQVQLTGTTIQLVTGSSEVALYGVDAEVGFKVPLFENGDDSHELRLFAGGFHFDQDNVAKEIAGPRGRAEFRMYDILGGGSRLTLGGELQRDDVRGTEAYGTVQIRIPLQAENKKRLTGLDRRMTNAIQRDVDIVSGLVGSGPGSTGFSEDVIVDELGASTGTIVFVDKYADGEAGTGTFENPTTLEQAQDITDMTPGIIVLNDDGNSFGGNYGGITLQDNQALLGGGTQVMLTGAETGARVPWTVPTDPEARRPGTNFYAYGGSQFVRLADNNQVQGFNIESYGPGRAIYGGAKDGINRATIRDMGLYGFKKEGIRIKSYGYQDRSFTIDNVRMREGQYFGDGIRLDIGLTQAGYSAGPMAADADDGITNIDINVTNNDIYSDKYTQGVDINIRDEGGYGPRPLAAGDWQDVVSNVNVSGNRLIQTNGESYGYSPGISVSQSTGGKYSDPARSTTLNLNIDNNTIGGHTLGVAVFTRETGSGVVNQMASVSGNAIYGAKVGVAVKNYVGWKGSSEYFGDANYTFKGAPQVQLTSQWDINNNTFMQPDIAPEMRAAAYGGGVGYGVNVYNFFNASVVAGDAETVGHTLNINNNVFTGARYSMIIVENELRGPSLSGQSSYPASHTAPVNSDARLFVNQQINIAGNSNTATPDGYLVPKFSQPLYNGIAVDTYLGGKRLYNYKGSTNFGLTGAHLVQGVNVTNNTVNGVRAPAAPTYEYGFGVVVSASARVSDPSYDTALGVKIDQTVNVSNNTVTNMHGGMVAGPAAVFYGPGYYGPGYYEDDAVVAGGVGIAVGAMAQNGAVVNQTGTVSGNTVDDVEGRGILIAGWADTEDTSYSYEGPGLQSDNSQLYQGLTVSNNTISKVNTAGYGMKGPDFANGGSGIFILQLAGHYDNKNNQPSFGQYVTATGNTISDVATYGIVLAQGTYSSNVGQYFTDGGNTMMDGPNYYSYKNLLAVQYGPGKQYGDGVYGNGYSCYQYSDGAGIQEVCNSPE